MGKPKVVEKKDGQHRHNAQTRWHNSKNKPVPFYHFKDNDGHSYSIDIPHHVLWDPDKLEHKGLPEPFDTLHLDWLNELAQFAVANGLKLAREQIDVDLYEYSVLESNGEPVITVESRRNVMFEGVKKRHKRRRK